MPPAVAGRDERTFAEGETIAASYLGSARLVSSVTWAPAKAEIRDLLAWRPARIDTAMLEDAWWLESRFELGHWDALIVAAARATGCRYLLTEDLQAGQVLDGLLIVDPFKLEPHQLPMA